MNGLFSLAVLILCVCSIVAVKAGADVETPNLHQDTTISKIKWSHGSPDCETNTDPTLDVYQHDPETFIIRQNKCLTYEAPFVYVLVGTRKILVLDTGAIKNLAGFSMYQSIINMIGENQLAGKEILVLHSHGHRDHYSGDADFDSQPNVTLIKPTARSVWNFFKFTDWPERSTTIDLGGRIVTIISTPGHQEEAITLYDHRTRWLLTGDTLYPGIVYVKNWTEFRKSVARLTSFASQNEISAILGAHVEMKNESVQYYPIGTTYQPNEAPLELSVQHLRSLNEALKKNSKPQKLEFVTFIVKPMGRLQKTISNVVRWFTQ